MWNCVDLKLTQLTGSNITVHRTRTHTGLF